MQDFLKSFEGRRRQSTSGGNKKAILKEWDISGRKVGDIGGIILGDNLTRQCLVLKFNELFQINIDCVTENACYMIIC